MSTCHPPGSICYQGPIQQGAQPVAFFEGAGHPCPKLGNPADFLFEVLVDHAEKIRSKFQAAAPTVSASPTPSTTASTSVLTPPPFPPPDGGSAGRRRPRGGRLSRTAPQGSGRGAVPVALQHAGAARAVVANVRSARRAIQCRMEKLQRDGGCTAVCTT